VPRAATKRAPIARVPRAIAVTGSEYIAKLEQRLILLRWGLAKFGYANNRELLEDCAKADEGIDESGVFRVTLRLLSKVSDAGLRRDIKRHDANIRRHLERMNQARAAEPVQLRYFQVLALLFTELYLDRLANAPGALLTDLNHTVADANVHLPAAWHFPLFKKDDLRKLAFWMATGSGKTLLLHLNLWQYRHYFPQALDNILLITPNEGLSEQHIAEARASGVTVERFDLERPTLLGTARDTLQVIEITKLVEEKRGGGVTVPVSRFSGNNLIFVDEGHKGAGGEAWKKYRDQLAETGFTFEYSATFGQALNAAGRDDLTDEYGKAIVFDYSYKYFHGDGFGKDFRLVNLDSDAQETRDTLLAASLLSYYEQLCVFDANPVDWLRYGIEKPLWVFVGAKVSGSGSTGSDIIAILEFLDRFLANEHGKSVKRVKELLHDKRRFRDEHERNVLEDSFTWLRRRYPESADFAALYADILRRVFHLAGAGGGVELQPIRGADGEIAIRVLGADTPFGVINVGDTAGLIKQVREDGALAVLEDAIGGSLFDGINRQGSTVNLLVGAKKFIEGWSSWRVSCLGLLNVGKSEGAQIIQLFGRGVRLLGLGRSLKRSSSLPGLTHPADIAILECLNVFSVKASYMKVFRESLLREGVDETDWLEIELPLWKLPDPTAGDLVYFQPPEPTRFRRQEVVALREDVKLAMVKLDASDRLSSYRSADTGMQTAVAVKPSPRPLKPEQMDLVDWDHAYFRVLEKKRLRGWSNAIIKRENLRGIMEHGCEIIADDSFFEIGDRASRQRLQEAVCEALETYFERYYRLQQNRFETRNLDAKMVRETAAVYPSYTVQVRLDQATLIAEIEHLAKQLRAGKAPDWDKLVRLRNLRFERHLYQPLLLDDSNHPVAYELSPPGLVKSESDFVAALKSFWAREKNGCLRDHKLFLLRNQSRGKGLGFYESHGFFPDFILWLVHGSKQRILFVEPHGLLMEAQSSDKLDKFHEKLASYVNEGLSKAKLHGVSVDGWILSATPRSDLCRQWGVDWNEAEFAGRHILFPASDYDAALRAMLDIEPETATQKTDGSM
jgi:hypothetical protein